MKTVPILKSFVIVKSHYPIPNLYPIPLILIPIIILILILTIIFNFHAMLSDFPVCVNTWGPIPFLMHIKPIEEGKRVANRTFAPSESGGYKKAKHLQPYSLKKEKISQNCNCMDILNHIWGPIFKHVEKILLICCGNLS